MYMLYKLVRAVSKINSTVTETDDTQDNEG